MDYVVEQCLARRDRMARARRHGVWTALGTLAALGVIGAALAKGLLL